MISFDTLMDMRSSADHGGHALHSGTDHGGLTSRIRTQVLVYALQRDVWPMTWTVLSCSISLMNASYHHEHQPAKSGQAVVDNRDSQRSLVCGLFEGQIKTTQSSLPVG